MRILVACGNGSGTSLMLRKTVEKAMKKQNLKITQIHQTAVSEGKNTAKNFDAVFTPVNFVSMFDRAKNDYGVTVIGIKNVMSEQEVTKAIEENEFKTKFYK
ncbi:PTS sugar transporter subunit IIB [Eremococcus coleocola]|uniref:PTS sugar transporter subunit IIB n=1 Tax=Eremococcus coleocola TaxID=88132 RepID=UPI0003F7783B|nr:PTS sugar transporter subunit IIB [Eremococcus coleocola]